LFLSPNGGYLLYYPQAFDLPNRRMRVPAEKRIAIEEADAAFCNAVIDSVGDE